MSATMCYICGNAIGPGEASTDDHRVQRLLLEGAQPRRRGFDYGGVAPTHAECNNEFRDEVNAAAALRIMRALSQPNATIFGVHPDDPTLPVQALNSEIFGAFTDAELAHFKIGNATTSDTLPTPAEIRKGTKSNLLKQTVPIALSVLVKSSTALLVDRHGLPASAPRTIWATAWQPDPGFVQTLREDGYKPFHEEVFWKVNAEKDVIEVRYYAHGILVYFWFMQHPTLAQQQRLIAALPQVDHWVFEGSSLRELETRPWKLIHQGAVDRERNIPCGCGSGRRFKHCHGAGIFR
jgi:SEC-C motif